MPIHLVIGPDDARHFSNQKDKGREDGHLVLRYFGRSGGSLESFLMLHSPGPDGRCKECVKKLLEAHPILESWFWDRVIILSPYAHVAWSYRGKADQDLFYEKGSSKVQWPNSAHNRRVPIDESHPYDVTDEKDSNTRPESVALDLFEVEDGITKWSAKFFYDLANDNKRPAGIIWGGTWKSFGDRDHFQIITGKDKEALNAWAHSEPHQKK